MRRDDINRQTTVTENFFILRHTHPQTITTYFTALITVKPIISRYNSLFLGSATPMVPNPNTYRTLTLTPE